MDSELTRFAAPLRRYGIFAAVVTVLVACLVQAGWALDIPRLRAVAPALVPMHPLTAAQFLLLGASLLLALTAPANRLLYRVHKVLAAVVILVGSFAVADYALGWQTGLPDLLSQASGAQPGPPVARPALGTSINFILLGLALLLRGYVSLRLVVSLSAVMSLIISIIALYGYILGVPSLYSMLFYSSMALNTALLFFLLSLASLFNNPYGWVVRTLFRDGTGGRLARWLMPFALFGPAILSLLLGAGERRGLYQQELAGALLAMTMAVTFSLLILVFAWRTSTLDALRRTKEALEKSHAELRDVADDLVRANLHLERLSTTDPLTELPNRRVFNRRLEEELARSHRYGLSLSVLMLDVDNFKSYNDSFGHPAGDEVLKSIASLLAQSVREVDCVARLGGEEFAVVMPETDKARALRSAERIRATIERAPWPKRRVTVSVGVASLSRAWDGVEAMTQAADAALYDAKRGGRNRVTGARPHVVQRSPARASAEAGGTWGADVDPFSHWPSVRV